MAPARRPRRWCASRDPGAECELDDRRRTETEGVRAGPVPVGDEDDASGTSRIEGVADGPDRVGGDERKVDREDEESIRAAGRDIVPCLDEARD